MIFEGFGTTFVYVVVRRVVFDFGISFIFGVLNVRWCFLGVFRFCTLMHGCMCLHFGVPHLSFVFVFGYFMTPTLALLVLVRTHCDFNKFHFCF